MNQINLNAIDLNLLKVFHAIDSERQLTRAGEKIGLTQSAVSHALKRLREIFDDELFVRTPTGMSPTPRCEQLNLPIKKVLEDLDVVFNDPQNFSPSSLDQTFILGMSEYALIALLPQITLALQKQAPKLTLGTVHARRREGYVDASVKRLLDNQTIDIAVAVVDDLQPRFSWVPLYQERLVCVMSADNPLAGQALDLKAYLSMGHVQTSQGETPGGWIEEHLAKQKLKRRIVLHVPNHLAALATVAKTKLLTIVTENSVKMHARPQDLYVCPLPFKRQAETTDMVWLKSRNNDRAHKWVRRTIEDCLSNIEVN
jgi:DNA-binding transcriptional LysR family regulator